MTQRIPDLYAILGVAPDANSHEIKSAFRRQSKRCHPDAGGSAEVMIALLQAYEVLSDPHTRSEYDAYLREQARPGWDATYQQTAETAKQTYATHGQEWEELMRWVDLRSEEIQASVSGRLAAGAVTGLLVGAAMGAICGSLLGIGSWAGCGIGAVCGALGGGIYGGSSAAPVRASVTD